MPCKVPKGVSSLKDDWWRCITKRNKELVQEDFRAPRENQEHPIHEGRYNHAGQPHWYLADSIDTGSSEILDGEAGIVFAQQFELAPCENVLDLWIPNDEGPGGRYNRCVIGDIEYDRCDRPNHCDRSGSEQDHPAARRGTEDRCGLRVFVQGGGCSGFQYGLMIEDGAGDAEVDKIFRSNGVTIFVDPISIRYLTGAEVDFVDNLSGGGFMIKNPTAKTTCGCGQSFGV